MNPDQTLARASAWDPLRILNTLLGVAMLGFTAVQYNDPDGLLWALYYLVPAVWAFIAAYRLELARSGLGQRLLWASLAIWLGLVIFYWPAMPNFWLKEVWMQEETAREGMGLMIAWLAVLTACVTARRKP